MLLHSILTLDRTRAQLNVQSKKQALETLADLFANSVASIDANNLYTQLTNRERLGTTGLGMGIAIPHCRFANCSKTYAACITLSSPIDFDSVDEKPVDLIFAMLVPENAETSHLETLSSLAQKLQSGNFTKTLRDASSDSALFDHAIADT